MFFSIIIPSIFFRASSIYIYTKLRTDINFINKFFPSIRSAIPNRSNFRDKKVSSAIQFSEFVINRYSIDRSLEHIFSNDCSIILLRPQFHRDEIF